MTDVTEINGGDKIKAYGTVYEVTGLLSPGGTKGQSALGLKGAKMYDLADELSGHSSIVVQDVSEELGAIFLRSSASLTPLELGEESFEKAENLGIPIKGVEELNVSGSHSEWKVSVDK